LALVTYFHEKWDPDWGGERIIYDRKKDQQRKQTLEITHCIIPQSRSLALFAVPRFHRVCRIDHYAQAPRRLFIVA